MSRDERRAMRRSLRDHWRRQRHERLGLRVWTGRSGTAKRDVLGVCISAWFFVAAASVVLGSANAEVPQVPLETKLVATDATGSDNFGAALAVDGDTMVVAAPWAEYDGVERSGAVYVYLRDAATGAWHEHQRLMPADGNYDSVRMSVAVDDDTIVIGAYYATLAEYQEGAVYVFARGEDEENWHEVKKLTDLSVGFGGHLGIAVSLEGDLLAVGADMQPTLSDGKVVLFERHRGGTDNWGEVVTLYDGVVGDGGTLEAFGSAVALSGELLLVGAERADVSGFGENDGAAYLFRRNDADPDQWDYVTRFIAPGSDACVGGQTLTDFFADPESDTVEADRCRREDSRTDHDYFGGAVALDGDTVVIGARSADNDDGALAGAVHVFERDTEHTDQWHPIQKFVPDAAYEYFGGDLAFSDGALLVGAHGATFGASTSQGAVYTFERDAEGAWQAVEKLYAFDGVSNGYFGDTVALAENEKIVGAWGDQNARGAVYIGAPIEEPLPADEPTDPPYAPTGELLDDAVLVSDTGVMLGTIKDTVLESLPIWVHSVPAPDEPLFANAKAVGDYYNIGAVETTSLPTDSGFVLGLPVPATADPSKIVAAGLISIDPLAGGADAVGPLWWPVPGVYDAANEVYLVTLSALFQEGTTFVLIEHPNTPPTPEPSVPEGEAAKATTAIFDVNCFPWLTSGICDAALEQEVESELVAIHAEFEKLGFREPALHGLSATIARDPENDDIEFVPADTVHLYYQSIYLVPQVRHCKTKSLITSGGGWYDPLLRALFLCVNNYGHVRHETTRHEYFHAIQASYWGALPIPPAHFWVREGMATAVEGVPDLRRDSGFGLHRIDESLSETIWTNVVYAPYYETQDFFVYLGTTHDKDLSYLIDFLEAGGPYTQTVADAIAQSFGSTLQIEYWNWVRNQVMEKEIDYDPDGPGGDEPPLQDPCNVQWNVISPPGWVGEKVKYEITYPQEDTIEFDLGYLTAELVEIRFENVDKTHVRVKAEAKGVAPDPAFRVYTNQPGDVDDAACRNIADGPRTFDVPPVAEQQPPLKAYVLLANTRYEGSTPVSYTVTVEPWD